MTISAALALSRFVHILAVSVLFGAALFPFYGLAILEPAAYERLSWLRRILVGAALLAMASGIAWFASLAAEPNGSPSTAVTAAFLRIVRDTNFGWVWPLRLLLGAGLVLLLIAWGRVTEARLKIVVLGSVLLLASLALTGNAGNNDGTLGLQHRIVDAVHLVASGVWVGALVVFARLVISCVRCPSDDGLQTLHHALSRFSGVGTISVAVLTLSGMLNPGFFLSSFRTIYGQVLLLKLALFALMLVLAAINRFWLTPRLSQTLSSAGQVEPVLLRLRASVVVETALAIVILALVGVLGTLTFT